MPNDWRDANVSLVFKSGSQAVAMGLSCPEIPDIPIVLVRGHPTTQRTRNCCNVSSIDLLG